MAKFCGSDRFPRLDDGFPKEEKKRKTAGSKAGASGKELSLEGKELDDGSPEEENKRRASRLKSGTSSRDLSLKGKELQMIPHKVSHSRRPSSDTHKKKAGFADTSSSGHVLTHPNTPTVDWDWLYPRDKGYTTVGFIFHEGVYLAADHASKSHVSNIIELGSSMVATISGASDSLLNDLKNKLQMAGNQISVVEASKRIACFLSSYGEEGLSVEMLIGGVDEGGPALYYVDGKGKSEDCKEKLVYSSGERPHFVGYATGSGYKGALAVLHVQLYPQLPAAIIERVAKNAICFGIRETLVAGSFVSVYHVDQAGWKKVISGDYVREWLGLQNEWKNAGIKI